MQLVEKLDLLTRAKTLGNCRSLQNGTFKDNSVVLRLSVDSDSILMKLSLSGITLLFLIKYIFFYLQINISN